MEHQKKLLELQEKITLLILKTRHLVIEMFQGDSSPKLLTSLFFITF